jgi:hypothetical protein
MCRDPIILGIGFLGHITIWRTLTAKFQIIQYQRITILRSGTAISTRLTHKIHPPPNLPRCSQCNP